MATQAEGTVLIHEWMFPRRMYWVGSLESMGARLVLCDSHRVVVVGPSQLYGGEVRSPDIRAGMALLAATMWREGDERDEQRRTDRPRLRRLDAPARARREDRARRVTRADEPASRAKRAVRDAPRVLRCSEFFEIDTLQQTCSNDGGPLLVRYDLRRVHDSIGRTTCARGRRRCGAIASCSRSTTKEHSHAR